VEDFVIAPPESSIHHLFKLNAKYVTLRALYALELPIKSKKILKNFVFFGFFKKISHKNLNLLDVLLVFLVELSII